MYDKGFLVITSNIEIDNSLLPFKISENMVLSKGSVFERDTFQNVLKDGGYFSKLVIPVGTEMKVSDTDGSISWEPNENYIPYIVTYSNFNRQVPDLQLAGALLKQRLLFGMQGFYWDENHDRVSGHTLMSTENLYWMGQQARFQTVTYDASDLEELATIFKLICSLSLDNHYRRIIELYENTRLIISNTSLLTLSYFSILEALLTNQSGASITKQLENKINLVFNIDGSIDHQPFFGEIGKTKLWSKLYALRSNIAHGNSYTIDTNLKGFEEVNIFLNKVVVKVLRFSLKNQQLVEDLKEC